jgi:hypothetical protein
MYVLDAVQCTVQAKALQAAANKLMQAFTTVEADHE